MWLWTKTGGNQYVPDRLPRYLVPKSSDRLDDFGVSLAGFSADSNDHITELSTIRGLPGFSVLDFGRFGVESSMLRTHLRNVE